MVTRLLLAPLLLAGFVQQGQQSMATWVGVQLPAESQSEAAAVFAVFDQVEQELNEWKPGTPLAAVNAGAGTAVSVPPALLDAVERGLEIGRATDGAFDITWAALWGLWDFRAEKPAVPDAAEIDRRRALVDLKKVVVDRDRSTLKLPEAGMKIGLGGIAKGWALDRAAAQLKERGVEDFLLSAGGQVYAGGDKEGQPWRVGIRDPRGAAEDFFAVVSVRDGSVSTSGDYERCFVVDGALYHHLLDPRTGRPARGLRSATVVATEATVADALSTALMVLGVERGLQIVEAMAGVEALLVDDSGAWHTSSGLKAALELVHPPKPSPALPDCPAS
jgi:FAD:protein FMN transferase